jgi:hypothetical protein
MRTFGLFFTHAKSFALCAEVLALFGVKERCTFFDYF